MFTGIISDIGCIIDIDESKGGHKSYHIATSYPLDEIQIGASIACEGVCLTVEDKGHIQGQPANGWFCVTASPETLNLTNLKKWNNGKSINLEQALKAQDELGGHFVFGHVDDRGQIINIIDHAPSKEFHILMPKGLKPLFAKKGSVAINGVSLTINDINQDYFSLMIIPHTLSHTTLHSCKIGDLVHLEADMLARYVARQLDFKL